MIVKVSCSTDDNGVRAVNKSSYVKILSIIRDRGIIPFDLVKENKDTYVRQPT